MFSKLIKLVENKWLKGILLGLLGFSITVLYTLTDLFLFDSEVVMTTLKENGEVLFQNILLSALISFIFTFVSYIIGYSFSRKLHIVDKKIVSKPLKYIIGFVTLIMPIILVVIDIKISPLSYQTNISYTLYNFIVSIFNNGVIEELWLRMGAFTFIYYGVNRIINKNKDVISKKIINALIVIFALFITLIQLNIVLDLYSYTFDIFVVLRLLVYNLLLNIYLNYFYVYYGIKKSILLHILFICMYVGLIPMLLNILF